MNRIQETFSVSESLLENMIESNLRKKFGIFAILIILLSFIVSCKAETEQITSPVENMGKVEASDDRALGKVLQNGIVNLYENEVEAEEDDMDRYYGHYKISRFCPTRYYSHIKYDSLPDQEADMMIGRTVIIEPDLLVTCDSERRLGTREGRDYFYGNYMIKEFVVDNPQYTYIPIASHKLFDSILTDPDAMSGAVGELFDQIEGVITIPDLCSPFGTQYYYTLTDENKVIMYQTLNMQYFVLEKVSEDQEKLLPEELSDKQKNALLEEVYGDYEITDFLPTKFFPALDSNGYEILPQQEADMMLGQKIVISEEIFWTYDNNRLPTSDFEGRLEEGFQIKKVEIEDPEYRVESKLREDIYGLRDDMLPDNLLQKEYIEIDVFPGYYTRPVGLPPDRILPQLFLVEDGQIILYAMGQYFLLEKLLDEQEQNNFSNTVTLGKEIVFQQFEDYKRYLTYEDEDFIKYVYTYESDGYNLTLEQALDLCAFAVAEQSPNLKMDRVMEQEEEGFVGYKFNLRELGDGQGKQIIENKIGIFETNAFDGMAYCIYMYEDIIDDLETGEEYTAITATFHIFLRDKLLIEECSD